MTLPAASGRHLWKFEKRPKMPHWMALFALNLMQCQRGLEISRVKNVGNVFELSGVAFRLAPTLWWASCRLIILHIADYRGRWAAIASDASVRVPNDGYMLVPISPGLKFLRVNVVQPQSTGRREWQVYDIIMYRYNSLKWLTAQHNKPIA